jgi:hypothetical protein
LKPAQANSLRESILKKTLHQKKKKKKKDGGVAQGEGPDFKPQCHKKKKPKKFRMKMPKIQHI